MRRACLQHNGFVIITELNVSTAVLAPLPSWRDHRDGSVPAKLVLDCGFEHGHGLGESREHHHFLSLQLATEQVDQRIDLRTGAGA